MQLPSHYSLKAFPVPGDVGGGRASGEFDYMSAAAILGEVYSSPLGIVGQGIDDQLDVSGGGCCLSSQTT
jgi:hypothetical protein